MEITEEKFTEAVGRPPENDDLERCNCEDAGTAGHRQCGWCADNNKPVFMCACSKCIGRMTGRAV